MMDKAFCAQDLPYGNILYIGDNGRECLMVIEKFTRSLRNIEKNYFDLLQAPDNTGYFPLQHYIQYHFEGGIAIFRFKNDMELPSIVRNECLVACQRLVFEQLVCSSQPSLSLN